MYPGDARERSRLGLLPDARVRHYWDEQRSIGVVTFNLSHASGRCVQL
jgi:hypothetical protein